MKIAIPQNILLKALEKGSMAAMSEEVQKDTTSHSLIAKSIKITVDKNFTVESSTKFMDVKHFIPITEESKIVVKEEGCVLIPAKVFIDWIKTRGPDATIGLTLSKLDTPEEITSLDDFDASGEDRSYSVKKIGSVKIVSKDSLKTIGRWELDCYDPKQQLPVNFKEKSQKHFDIKAKQLSDGISKIAVATVKDYEHIYDSASMQAYKGKLYFATTDMKRCAVYQIPEEDVGDIQSNSPLLIPLAFLQQVSSISDENSKLSFFYNEEKEKVFVSQPNIEVRMASVEKDNIKKFPGIKVLLEKNYELFTEIPRSELNKGLVGATIVNNSSALFTFKKGSKTLLIQANSEEGRHPNTTEAKIKEPTKDVSSVYGVVHLIDALRVIKDDTILFYIPDNLKSIKIIGKENKNFMYFAMTIVNPIYDTSKKS